MSFPAKIKKIFLKLQDQNVLTQELADKLCDIQYCKEHKLQTEFPVLRLKGMSEFDASGKNRRYYPFHKFHLKTENKNYLFTNNWYERNKSEIKLFFVNLLPMDIINNILDTNNEEKIQTKSAKIIRRRKVKSWPVWELPSIDDIQKTTHLLTPYLKFINPKIIEKITLSNNELESYFRAYMASSGIDYKYYIWKSCSTMFPAIRRANGKTDNEFKKRQLPIELRSEKNAIYIDDNSYPKHIWAFIFTGQQFSNKGPIGYELAHIFEHKAVDRINDELSAQDDSNYDISKPLSGMFTSAACLMYAPRTFVKVTDHSLQARRLIQRKIMELYKDTTSILPPTIELKKQDEEWEIDSFVWGKPVGDLDQIELFLEYRKDRLEKILNLEIPAK